MEKAREYERKVFFCFIDYYSKAFDCVESWIDMDYVKRNGNVGAHDMSEKKSLHALFLL